MNDNTRLFALKAAFRDLVKQAGGQDRAAMITGFSQSKICEATSANHLDRAPRLDHVAILEADAGVPLVTKQLAEWAGYELVPLGTFTSIDPHVHLARIIQQAGDVTGATSQALVDGKISKAEAQTLKREADEAIVALQSFIAQLNDILSGR